MTQPHVLALGSGRRAVPSGGGRPTAIDKRPVDAFEVRDPGPKRGGLGSGVVGDEIGNPKHHGGELQAVYAYPREDQEFWEQQIGRPIALRGIRREHHDRGASRRRTLSSASCGGSGTSCCGSRSPASRAGRSPRTWASLDGCAGSPRPGAPAPTCRSSRRASCTAGARIEVERPDHDIDLLVLFRAFTGDLAAARQGRRRGRRPPRRPRRARRHARAPRRLSHRGSRASAWDTMRYAAHLPIDRARPRRRASPSSCVGAACSAGEPVAPPRPPGRRPRRRRARRRRAGRRTGHARRRRARRRRADHSIRPPRRRRPPSSRPSTADSAPPSTLLGGLDIAWSIAVLPDGSALVSERNTGRDPPRAQARLRGQGDRRRTAAHHPHGGRGRPARARRAGGLRRRPRLLRVLLDRQRQPHRGRAVARRHHRRAGRHLLGHPPWAGTTTAAASPSGPTATSTSAPGEAGDTSLSQNLGSLGGKILRITPDGDPAPGNPFGGSPIWSYGHRNVQGLAWDSRKRLWASEFGQNTFDELNLIEPGKNYGWPEVEGRAGNPDFVDPVAEWPTSEMSPSGIAVGPDGAVYMAALRGQSVWRVPRQPRRHGRHADPPPARDLRPHPRHPLRRRPGLDHDEQQRPRRPTALAAPVRRRDVGGQGRLSLARGRP